MLLNRNFDFSRKMPVKAAILFKNESEPKFYTMKLEKIENGEYVLYNRWPSKNNHPKGKKNSFIKK